MLLLNYGAYILKQNIFQFNYIIKFINIFKKVIESHPNKDGFKTPIIRIELQNNFLEPVTNYIVSGINS